MIVSIGVDTVAIDRIRNLLDRPGRFTERVFTDAERNYCSSRDDPASSFAARFAAKEAVMKCLGTGWGRGVAFGQIEVGRSEVGADGEQVEPPPTEPGPTSILLTGEAARRAAALGIDIVHISLTHERDHAMAFAVAERLEQG